ncbi:hypothetical protein TNCV_4112261 [Trichonephila clavipes]|nr:hypothetical protein TNCV_4112261 [Trichonephila clavipes]
MESEQQRVKSVGRIVRKESQEMSAGIRVTEKGTRIDVLQVSLHDFIGSRSSLVVKVTNLRLSPSLKLAHDPRLVTEWVRIRIPKRLVGTKYVVAQCPLSSHKRGLESGEVGDSSGVILVT